MNEVIKKNGIKFGILLGLAGILLELSIYLIGGLSEENKVLSIFIKISFWLSFLLIRIFQIISTKKQLNGIISFKEVFTTLFICILNGILISQIFTYLLMNHIDIEYGNLMNEFTIREQLELAKMAGAKSDQLKEIASLKNYSISNILQGTAITILISSVMNLILAAIFKSKSTNSPFNE